MRLLAVLALLAVGCCAGPPRTTKTVAGWTNWGNPVAEDGTVCRLRERVRLNTGDRLLCDWERPR